MFCNKCGNELKSNDKFCSRCGNKIGGNGNGDSERRERRELNKTTISQTFKGGFLLTNPFALLDGINNYLSLKNLIYVNCNFSIYKGIVKSITLNCDEIREVSDYIYQMDYIKFGSLWGTRNPDKYINEWIERHPDTKIVHQRIVNMNGMAREGWILYKFKRR